MFNVFLAVLAGVTGYLLGSIPFALILGKLIGKIDVREHGSGNLGGTNVIRSVGLKTGILVIVCDIGKGFLAAFLGTLIGGPILGVVAGIGAVIGHSYPLFAGFKGGKSVATGAGAFLFLAPIQIGIALIVFAIVLLIFKYVSLASIIAAITGCLMMLLPFFDTIILVRIFGILVALFVIYKHRGNIVKLRDGTEKKIFGNKK